MNQQEQTNLPTKGEHTEQTILPPWLATGEQYVASNDHDGYIVKTLLDLVGLLSRFRQVHIAKQHGNAAIILGCTLGLILLVSLSRNFFFVLLLFAFVLIRLCLLDTARMKAAILPACTATVFTALIMIPALFLGQTKSLLNMTVRVFTCTGLLSIVSVTVRWNRLTEGLRFYRLPSIFIFTLDITLKFISLLGETALETLQALRLRSVGKNREKGRSLGGVLGMTLLHAKELSEELYGAMQLRGFDGEYHPPVRFKIDQYDILTLAGFACAIAAFLLLRK